MIKKTIISAFSFLILGLTPSSPAFAQSVDELILMTENYPPLNFSANGRLQGISVDLMDALLKKLGSRLTRHDIQLLPWARGYATILNTRNTCLFAMTRTREREPLFKWVGPICSSRIVLIAKKTRHIRIRSASDLWNYKIGAVRNDVGEQLLLEKGVAKEALEIVTLPDHNAKMLRADRIDLWACGEIVAKWVLKQNGLRPGEFTTAYVLLEGDQYIAFHRDTPDALINKFQSALDELKRQGTVKKILDTYVK
ncbi:MAG TPA: transporter substrate-binding domain-containing protein [Desulfuromonadaceae bacterium]